MVRQRSSRVGAVSRRVAALTVITLFLSLLPSLSGLQVQAIPRTQVGHLDRLVSGIGLTGSESGTDAIRRAPMAFSMVGFLLPEGADRVRVRTSWDGRSWTEWRSVERQAAEGPDPGSAESGRAPAGVTEPVWTGRARYLHVSVPGAAVGDVGAALVDSLGLEGGPADLTVTRGGSAEAAARPGIVSRGEWGARPYDGSPEHADDVSMMVVHHTVTSNSYTEAEAPGVVRAIQAYHQDVNGWNDIGYNLLVDRFGNVYEGRGGGLRRPVIGAHASGHNAGSSGVALLGTHSRQDPSRAAISALVRALAWKADIHDIDPQARTTRVGGGSPAPTVAGHRDIGQTTCPGGAAYDDMGGIRAAVARSLSNDRPRPDDTGLLDDLLGGLL